VQIIRTKLSIKLIGIPRLPNALLECSILGMMKNWASFKKKILTLKVKEAKSRSSLDSFLISTPNISHPLFVLDKV